MYSTATDVFVSLLHRVNVESSIFIIIKFQNLIFS